MGSYCSSRRKVYPAPHHDDQLPVVTPGPNVEPAAVPVDPRCPLSGSTIRVPVVAPDGRTFDRDHLSAWLHTHPCLPGSTVRMPRSRSWPAPPWAEEWAARVARLDVETPNWWTPPPANRDYGRREFPLGPPMPPSPPPLPLPLPRARSASGEQEPASRPRWAFVVRTLTGKILKMEADDEMTVLGLMDAIEAREGMPVGQQCLVLRGGQELNRRGLDTSLMAAGVGDNATVSLVLRMD